MAVSEALGLLGQQEHEGGMELNGMDWLGATRAGVEWAGSRCRSLAISTCMWELD